MNSLIDRGFEKRLAGLLNSGQPEILQGGRKGVEKESLRVTADGAISQAPHPRGLGSALTNENITTDYSEALIEFVTPTFGTSWELLQYLLDLHQFVYRHLDSEWLWATSMPCNIPNDAAIPLAQYGSSNVARMKTVYRNGLGLRYGRMMQAISGVHFNYSFPDGFWPVLEELVKSATPSPRRKPGSSKTIFRLDPGLRRDDEAVAFVSAAYFDLLRNYRRYGWIVLYLFGVSPVVCQCQPLVDEPFATSLRMSDIGYRSQAGVEVSVNSLEEYVRDLTRAIKTPHPPYEALGVKVNGPDGEEYRQLNANILQIENEYYSYIRPKRVTRSGEMPTKALQRAGVEYVEVRALDVSAFDPVGVNQNKLRFLEAFLALCLMKTSPPIGKDEQAALDQNHLTVARRGRDPTLTLWREGKSVLMRDWAHELLDEMAGLCEVLDRGDEARPYAHALAAQAAKIADVALTPSARLMRELHETGESFFQLALRMSKMHKDYFLELYTPNEERLRAFAAQASESLEKQKAIEASDRESFDAYLARYSAQ